MLLYAMEPLLKSSHKVVIPVTQEVSASSDCLGQMRMLLLSLEQAGWLFIVAFLHSRNCSSGSASPLQVICRVCCGSWVMVGHFLRARVMFCSPLVASGSRLSHNSLTSLKSQQTLLIITLP